MKLYIFSFSDIIDIVTLCVLFLTFLAIVYYSYETHKLRVVNQKQNFDTNFYNLLNSYHYLFSNLEFREHEDPRNIYKGDRFFKRFYDLFKVSYNKPSVNYKDKVANEKEVCKVIYNAFYDRYKEHFSHYFLSVSQILKFIDDADNIDESVKKKYLEIFQSCFTLNEMILLFYHGISNHCDKDTHLLLDRYSLLINISVNDLIDISHLGFYSQYDK